MNRIVVSTSKYLVAILLAFVLASPIKSQVGLREALDFDGDGKADFSTFRPDNNFWYVLGSLGNVIIQPWGLANDDFLTPGDFNGDNVADIAVWRDTTGVWYILNSGTFTATILQWGTTGDEPVARDYDGDGKTDYAVVRRSNGQMTWWILRSSDGGFSATQWGLSTDYTVPGDYDGDGKYDIAIQRPGATPTSNATYYILQTTDGVKITQFGFGTDLAVPGDYDGDGKTDLAIVREGATANDQLTWHFLRSSDNSWYYIQYGLTGTDVIAQGDYNGDGKTDLAIWRNTDGSFYVLSSIDYSLLILQWGIPNDYPVAGYDTH